MSYVVAKVLTLDDEELGYVVVKEGTSKLEDSNLWIEGEGIEAHVADLNEQMVLKQHWPNARDEDVEALVNDPRWEPFEWTEEEVPVYEADDFSEQEPIGFQTVRTPVDPRAPMARFHLACETVARERAANAR